MEVEAGGGTEGGDESVAADGSGDGGGGEQGAGNGDSSNGDGKNVMNGGLSAGALPDSTEAAESAAASIAIDPATAAEKTLATAVELRSLKVAALDQLRTDEGKQGVLEAPAPVVKALEVL